MSLTIPNLLSIFRMGLVPVFIIAIIDGRPRQALAVFLLAGLTDALDGLIARFWHQQSRLGSYLDPMADKLLLVSAYTTLAIPSLNPSFRIPFWVAVLVIARDVLIVLLSLLLYLAHGVSKFPPAYISKITTTVQVVSVALVLLAGAFEGVELLAPLALSSLYLVAMLTVASGLNYVYLANRMVAARDEA